MEPLPIVRTVADLRSRVARWRQAGESVALVPTMGALHAGHLELVRHARRLASPGASPGTCRVVASVFVNPTQFAPHEDFDRYPRDEAGDAAKLASAGCDLMYLPDAVEMYPPGFATSIVMAGPAGGMCGVARPLMFNGVALVVTKLFGQVQPDVAVFGEKDYQQLQVVRRFTRDLDLPVRVEGMPTVREADGLALSSRNAYLTPAERHRAPELYRALQTAVAALERGSPVATVLADVRARLAAAGFERVDYVELRDASTLEPLERTGPPARLLVAAWMGRTRLIDNVAVPGFDGRDSV
jgi:pantoate--beta-alanine ligase